MKEETQELFCKQCCMKFDQKIWYDLHLSLVHRDGGKPELFQNPGFGFNPGFQFQNPGFSGSLLKHQNNDFIALFLSKWWI